MPEGQPSQSQDVHGCHGRDAGAKDGVPSQRYFRDRRSDRDASGYCQPDDRLMNAKAAAAERMLDSLETDGRARNSFVAGVHQQLPCVVCEGE